RGDLERSNIRRDAQEADRASHLPGVPPLLQSGAGSGAGGTALCGRCSAAARHSADCCEVTLVNMLGRQTLLITPPLINGVAFTRQGRCQEREDVLGTTKPPLTLALMASLLRDAWCRVRIIDATAGHLSI